MTGEVRRRKETSIWKRTEEKRAIKERLKEKTEDES